MEPAPVSDRAREFPLLHPPLPHDLSDRPRELPVITTQTDLSTAAYNAPLGPAPPPPSVPPRDRSRHFLAAVAAERLRTDAEARRAAQGLPPPRFPVVAVLGLEGSTVATLVERVLSGEDSLPDVDSRPLANGKRRRESTAPTSGKGKAKAESALVSLHALPNPFAGGAGASETASISRLPNPFAAPTSTSEQTNAASENAVSFEMEESRSPAGSTMSYDDLGEVKPNAASLREPGRKHRKSEVPPGERMIKPKKLKTHGITSGTYPIPFIQRHPDGTPVLPLQVGIMILRKLGVIIPREHFHTERYIFPVGFEAMRKYSSMVNTETTVEYICRIVDGGTGAPRFEILPSDQPGVIIAAGTPTGAWSQVVKSANRIRQRNHSNSVSGPDYYGLAQNVVKALIQELPNARDVPGYIWQTFVEEPDPAVLAPDELKASKKSLGGPRKVVGAKRKLKADDTGGASRDEDDEGHSMSVDGTRGFDGASPSSPAIYHQSLSPGATTSSFHSNEYNASPSLSNLVHGSPSNPYTLPPPVDPSSGPHSPRPASYNSFNDPYSLPPPTRGYQSPPPLTTGRWGEPDPLADAFPPAFGAPLYQPYGAEPFGYSARADSSSDDD